MGWSYCWFHFDSSRVSYEIFLRRVKILFFFSMEMIVKITRTIAWRRLRFAFIISTHRSSDPENFYFTNTPRQVSIGRIWHRILQIILDKIRLASRIFDWIGLDSIQCCVWLSDFYVCECIGVCNVYVMIGSAWTLATVGIEGSATECWMQFKKHHQDRRWLIDSDKDRISSRHTLMNDLFSANSCWSPGHLMKNIVDILAFSHSRILIPDEGWIFNKMTINNHKTTLTTEDTFLHLSMRRI